MIDRGAGASRPWRRAWREPASWSHDRSGRVLWRAGWNEGKDYRLLAALGYILGMAIHPDLLEILACPVCKTPVELVKGGAGLRCGQCKRVYPVRDDIPIMLPEEATVEG
jgi:uncharacterized protein YbaR (Trm112 family)